MPLQTTGKGITEDNPQVPGSVLTAVAKVRMSGQRPWSKDIASELANIGHQLQDQINRIYQLLALPQLTLDTFLVFDSMGALAGWIGDRAVNAVSYTGAWFRTFAIGGTSPADAKIVADSSGNVAINGASISLTANGVQTIIQNTADVTYGTESVKSLEIATGFYSVMTPHYFALNDGTNGYAYLSDAGNAGGRFSLSNPTTGAGIIAITAGGGAPVVSVSSAGGTTTVSVGPGLGLAVNNVSQIDPTGNAVLANMAITGNFTGTHAQNVGVTDSPTFANVTGGGTSLSLLLAALNTTNSNLSALAAQVATLNGGLISLAATVATINANYVTHGNAISGTANLTTGAVTGTIT